MTAEYAITLDIDWAPDWIIDQAAAVLARCGTRATWFATHHSPAVRRLLESPLFEVGIHPNFRPGSTHGDSERAVLAHMKDLFPDAASMRTHSLVQSTPLLIMAAEMGIVTDVSLFLPGQPHLKPHTLHTETARLVRVPYYWEDDMAFCDPASTWTPDWNDQGAGLRIFNFHPVHIALNASGFDAYNALKSGGPETWTPKKVASLRRAGDGTGTLFEALAKRLAGAGRTVSELAKGANA